MSIWCSINQFQDNIIVKNIYLIPLVWGIYELRRAVNQFIIFQEKVESITSLVSKYGKTIDSVNVKVKNVFDGDLTKYPFLKKLDLTLDKINRIVNIPSNGRN